MPDAALALNVQWPTFRYSYEPIHDDRTQSVLENEQPGTPQSTWAIHGSIANQGDFAD